MSYDPFSYWENRAPSWIHTHKPTKEMWALLKKYINPIWRVIEVGCGDGRWSEYFEDYTGVDISPSLLAFAQDVHPNKKFFHHDCRQSFDGSFDLVFSYTCLQHIPPKDIKNLKLPDANFLFVESHIKPNVNYCFKHNYEKLFGVKVLEVKDRLTIYGKFRDGECPHQWSNGSESRLCSICGKSEYY